MTATTQYYLSKSMRSLACFAGWAACLLLANQLNALPTPAAEVGCSADIEHWADALLQDLPAYANRELVRSGAETRIWASGFPDIDAPADVNAEQQTEEAEDTARIYFSTAERLKGNGLPPIERAYSLLLSRRPGETWFPLSLDLADEGHLPPTDITEGAIWQAIQQWQTAGCSID